MNVQTAAMTGEEFRVGVNYVTGISLFACNRFGYKVGEFDNQNTHWRVEVSYRKPTGRVRTFIVPQAMLWYSTDE